jgi:predicted HNH restriction endonuclease
MEVLKKAENPQDAVILALIFDGVNFKNKFEELINLKISDIDAQYREINLSNRVISISEETKLLLHDAINSTEYISSIGEERRYLLPNSQYVLKSPRGKKQIPEKLISQRIVRMSKRLDSLNATTTSYSGQLYYASKLLKEGISRENVISNVITRFDIRDNASARHKLRNMIEENLEDLLKNKERLSSNPDSLIDLKIIERDIDAEKAEEDEYYKDGSTNNYHGKRYERHPQNRKRAIEIHGTSCKICNFNFERFYGEHGKDFIEVHHIQALSTLKDEIIINPEKDLIPVCANCHRIIHRNKSKILSIEEVKKIIRHTVQ